MPELTTLVVDWLAWRNDAAKYSMVAVTMTMIFCFVSCLLGFNKTLLSTVNLLRDLWRESCKYN